MSIIVSPLSQITAVIEARRPSHLISLLDPATLIETPQGFLAERHLRLGVYDICDVVDGLNRPEEADVVRIVEFGRTWDEGSPLLVHCFAGISRSTAAAFVLACERNPQTPELDIAWRMRRSASHAYPNRRIVRLADDLLGRRGRMADAVEAIGDNGYAMMGTPFEIPARY